MYQTLEISNKVLEYKIQRNVIILRWAVESLKYQNKRQELQPVFC